MPSPCADLSTNNSLGLTIGYMDDVCQNYNKQQLLSLNTKLAVVKYLLWHLILTIHFEHTSIFIYLNLANIFLYFEIYMYFVEVI